jgi:hypothetical protein
MAEKKEHIHIAVLNAMISHVSQVMDEVQERIDVQASGKAHPSEQSISTLRKAHRDMKAQHDAIVFARDHAVKAFGNPPQVIEQAVHDGK